jgi:EAL domain-containing protein (putative c-di-GMP-specific phosphodiesterase class I)
VLHYQPKINLRTRAVIGVEALIRWQHPERGLLLPPLFLPAIANHPLAIDLGEWVIRTTLAQIADWQAAGLTVLASVNLGSPSLAAGELRRAPGRAPGSAAAARARQSRTRVARKQRA